MICRNMTAKLTMSSDATIVLLDADVISHFIACGELLYLPKILEPHNTVILDVVYNEVSRIVSRKNVLDNAVRAVKKLSVMEFPTGNLEIKREYALIKRENALIGDGERACMAVARYNKNIIASSNFRDIAAYCRKNDIPYLGTLDILTLALARGVFDTERCNNFIKTAIAVNNARFPNGVSKIGDYSAPDLSFI